MGRLARDGQRRGTEIPAFYGLSLSVTRRVARISVAGTESKRGYRRIRAKWKRSTAMCPYFDESLVEAPRRDIFRPAQTMELFVAKKDELFRLRSTSYKFWCR